MTVPRFKEHNQRKCTNETASVDVHINPLPPKRAHCDRRSKTLLWLKIVQLVSSLFISLFIRIMGIRRSNTKIVHILTKGKGQTTSLVKYRNDFYVRYKQCNKLCEKEITKEGIILKSYLFRKKEACLNEKDISKLLNKVIKKKIKNEYIWNIMKNLIFTVNLKYIENSTSTIIGHTKMEMLKTHDKRLKQYNKNMDHINVFLLSIAIQTLNKRDSHLFNFLFSYLELNYEDIQPRHFLHVFLVLVKNTYRRAPWLRGGYNGEHSVGNDEHSGGNDEHSGGSDHTPDALYAEKAGYSQKNFLRLLSQYCTENVNFYSYNDIGQTCEALCYFPLKENPFAEYWNQLLFYIFDVGKTRRHRLKEQAKMHTKKGDEEEPLCNGEGSPRDGVSKEGKTQRENYKHREGRSPYYGKYVDLSGRNILSVLKYVCIYREAFPEVARVGSRLKSILLQTHFELTLHECSEILQSLHYINEMDTSFLTEKIQTYECKMKDQFINTYDIQCLLKIAQLCWHYFGTIPFASIFFHNIHKIEKENASTLLQLLLQNYEHNLCLKMFTNYRNRWRNFTRDSNRRNYDSLGTCKETRKGHSTTPLVGSSYNSTDIMRQEDRFGDGCTSSFDDIPFGEVPKKSGRRLHKRHTCVQRNNTVGITKGGKTEQWWERDGDKFFRHDDYVHNDGEQVKCDDHLEYLFTPLVATCWEEIKKYTYKEIFFLCEKLNKEQFVSKHVLTSISNRICDDLKKRDFVIPPESQRYIEYILFIASFIYRNGYEDKKMIIYMVKLFLRNKENIQITSKYHYSFFFIIMKLGKWNIPIEYTHFVMSNIGLFHTSTLYNSIVIYFFKSAKNNYKFMLKGGNVATKGRKKKKKSSNGKKGRHTMKANIHLRKDITVSFPLTNTNLHSVHNERNFNVELLKIFLFLWNNVTPRPGRRFLDLLVALNKFCDSKYADVAMYLFNGVIVKRVKRYLELLRRRASGEAGMLAGDEATKSKAAQTTEKIITLCEDQVIGGPIQFDIENLFPFYERREPPEKNNMENTKNEYNNIMTKIEEGRNYLLNDYKHKMSIAVKMDGKSDRPAKFLKNCKRGSPVQHFLYMYRE
ncbi:conserved Plasmodium protein, unknown function [Plasmodium ovale wallikeri]|uniref:Uncharacterized protein n=1 Tax=Plasmodium ovale wallikeri TaxID=864142 RepID=A0A1A8YJU7_PLAOA|nr:conserved Plasmodium protein, unknown function [Plasmodium ovale wallikeri]